MFDENYNTTVLLLVFLLAGQGNRRKNLNEKYHLQGSTVKSSLFVGNQCS